MTTPFRVIIGAIGGKRASHSSLSKQSVDRHGCSWLLYRWRRTRGGRFRESAVCGRLGIHADPRRRSLQRVRGVVSPVLTIHPLLQSETRRSQRFKGMRSSENNPPRRQERSHTGLPQEGGIFHNLFISRFLSLSF